MDGDDFRTQMMYWYGGLIVLTLSFPFFLQGVVAATGCSASGGACGAVAAIVGMYVKPPLVFVIVIGIGVAMIRRMLSLELGYGWWIATFCWLLASSGIFISLGNFWGANFAMGLMGIGQVFTLFLVAFTVFLSFDLESSGWANDQITRLGWIAAGVSALHAALQMSALIVLAIPFLGLYIIKIPGAMALLGTIGKVSSLGLRAWWLPWLDFLIFVGALSLLVVRHNWSGGEPQTALATGTNQIANYKNAPEQEKRAQSPRTFGQRR